MKTVNTILFDVSKNELFKVNENYKMLHRKLKTTWKVLMSHYVVSTMSHKIAATILMFIVVMVTSVVPNPKNNEILEDLVNNGLLTSKYEASPDTLYNRVLAGDYEGAVLKTFALQRSGKDDVITSVLNRLLRENNKNTVAFAYKLWNMFGQSIVKDYFPIEFQLILSSESVRIMHIDGVNTSYLRVEENNDVCDDGLKNSEWKFEPLWNNDRVYFRLLNTYRHLYLSRGNITESKITSIPWIVTPKMNASLKFLFMPRSNFKYQTGLGLICGQNNKTDEFYGWYIKPF